MIEKPLNQEVKRLDRFDEKEDDRIVVDDVDYGEAYLNRVNTIQDKICDAKIDDSELKEQYLQNILDFLKTVNPENIAELEEKMHSLLDDLESEIMAREGKGKDQKEEPMEEGMKEVMEALMLQEQSRQKAIALLQLDSVRDQIILKELEDESYRQAILGHSKAEEWYKRWADTASLGYLKTKTFIDGAENRIEKLRERQILRDELVKILQEHRANTLNEAVGVLEKEGKEKICRRNNPITGQETEYTLDIPGALKDWKEYGAVMKKTGWGIDALELDQTLPAENIGQIALGREEHLRSSALYQEGKQLLLGLLQAELEENALDNVEKTKIEQEVKKKKSKEELKKSLMRRKEEMKDVLRDELMKNGTEVKDEKLEEIITKQIEEKSEAYEQSLIEEQARKAAFQKIDPDALKGDKIKSEAYRRLSQNYDLGDKWWVISDETANKVMSTIIIDGGMIALSGGIAAGVKKAVVESMGKRIGNRALLTVAELGIEGAAFHTAMSGLQTLSAGSEAWDNYWKGVAHSIGMFGAIKGGKMLWNKAGRDLLALKYGTGGMTKLESMTVKELTSSGELLSYLGDLATEVTAFTSYDISLELVHDLVTGENIEISAGKFLEKSGDNLAMILELRIGGKLFGPMVQKSLLKMGEKGKKLWEKIEEKSKIMGEKMRQSKTEEQIMDRESSSVASEEVLREHGKLDDVTRIQKAEELLGRKLTEEQKQGLLQAHYYPQGKNIAKGKRLMESGFTREEALILMDQGIAGTFVKESLNTEQRVLVKAADLAEGDIMWFKDSEGNNYRFLVISTQGTPAGGKFLKCLSSPNKDEIGEKILFRGGIKTNVPFASNDKSMFNTIGEIKDMFIGRAELSPSLLTTGEQLFIQNQDGHFYRFQVYSNIDGKCVLRCIQSSNKAALWGLLILKDSIKQNKPIHAEHISENLPSMTPKNINVFPLTDGTVLSSTFYKDLYIYKQFNFYDRLGVKPNATKEEIKKAYRKLLFIFHPDRLETITKMSPHIEGMKSEMKVLLDEAYDILSNPTKKEQYDRRVKLYPDRERLLEEIREDFDFLSNYTPKASGTDPNINASRKDTKETVKSPETNVYLKHILTGVKDPKVKEFLLDSVGGKLVQAVLYGLKPSCELSEQNTKLVRENIPLGENFVLRGNILFNRYLVMEIVKNNPDYFRDQTLDPDKIIDYYFHSKEGEADSFVQRGLLFGFSKGVAEDFAKFHKKTMSLDSLPNVIPKTSQDFYLLERLRKTYSKYMNENWRRDGESLIIPLEIHEPIKYLLYKYLPKDQADLSWARFQGKRIQIGSIVWMEWQSTQENEMLKNKYRMLFDNREYQQVVAEELNNLYRDLVNKNVLRTLNDQNFIEIQRLVREIRAKDSTLGISQLLSVENNYFNGQPIQSAQDLIQYLMMQKEVVNFKSP